MANPWKRTLIALHFNYKRNRFNTKKGHKLEESGLKNHPPFRTIEGYPDRIDSTAIIVRLLDGLGYRFYWASEGLSLEDCSYKITPEAKSTGQIIEHIWGLVNWMCIYLLGEESTRPSAYEEMRISILENIKRIRDRFNVMDSSDLEKLEIEKHPFWHYINGPISDALTHVGQINILRRYSGNPPIKAHVFSGDEPIL
ncbi:MAG: hypothetical protein HN590_01175 [Calditrichaeota bacterium]|jgi:hypothetical protein|nr:hypothetical protein [Calditrichota bacterium]